MRLTQIIAVEKGIKARALSEITEIYKTVQKPSLFNGFQKTYRKKHEEGEEFPPETKKVEHKADDLLQEASLKLVELFDITAVKDFANCQAKADIVVDGTVLVAQAPATYILFLEKQLTDLHTLVGKLPSLDPAEVWKFDANDHLFKTDAEMTIRTKKVQKALVKYPATPEHPAQTEVITEDEVVGYWIQTKHSGALPESKRKALLARIERLQKATKFAREEANLVQAEDKKIGATILNWIFA